MSMLRTLAVLCAALCPTALAASAEEWRSRSIYQVMTDRFALTNGSETQPCDTSTGLYCGGSYQGLINRLDYIQGMGFDAIWISPITQQVEGNSKDGSAYHGYWQTNINELNQNFGNQQDMQNLAAALHSRGMYLMVDLVVNHFGWNGDLDTIDYSTFEPFNSRDHFHDYCKIDYKDITNATNMQTCWMGDANVPLPDLRTESPETAAMWYSWINSFVSEYQIDGLRLDSVIEVDQAFWQEFQASAGVYSVGEANAPDADVVCSYQDYLPGVMNYGVYQSLINAFKNSTGSIGDLVNTLSAVQTSCADPNLLGTFSENHDVPRFASMTQDLSRAQNVLAFTLLSDGIPIVYQGQEQHYAGVGGGSVPYNREALWLSQYSTASALYTHTAMLNAIRKAAIASDSTFLTSLAQPVYHDYTNLALQKGSLVAVLSNVGAESPSFTIDVATRLGGGVGVTEVFSCETAQTAGDGKLKVEIVQGAPKAYLPTAWVGGMCPGRKRGATAAAAAEGGRLSSSRIERGRGSWW